MDKKIAGISLLSCGVLGLLAVVAASTSPRLATSANGRAAIQSDAQYLPVSSWNLDNGTIDSGYFRDRTSTFWDAHLGFHAISPFFTSIENNPSATFDLRSPVWNAKVGNYISFTFGGGTGATSPVASDGSNFINLWNQTKQKNVILNFQNPVFQDWQMSNQMGFYYFPITSDMADEGDEMLLYVRDGMSSGGFDGVNIGGLQVNQTFNEVVKTYSVYKANLETFCDDSAQTMKNVDAKSWLLSVMSSYGALTVHHQYKDGTTGDTTIGTAEEGYWKRLDDAISSLTDADCDFEGSDKALVNWAYDQDASRKADGSRYELHFTEAIQNKHGYQDYDMPYNGDGYFFDGNGSTAREENASFTLKSNSFTLSGVGLVSMKMAGRSLRFSLVDETDSSKNITFLNPCYLIKNYTVTESGNIPLSEGRMNTMTRVYVDAKALLGDMVHVEISDSDANYDWGLIFFDDLYTNYTSYPHFQIDKISQEYDSDGTHYGPYHGIVKDYFYSGNNPTATDFSSAYSFVSSWWGFRTSANNFSRCSGYATLQSSYGALSEAAKAIVRNSQDFDFGSYSGNFYDNEANTSLTIGDAISLTNW